MRTSLRLAQWSEPGGYRRKKKLGGRNPRGRGEGEKEQEGLVSSLGLGEGGSAVRMSSGKTKGRPG